MPTTSALPYQLDRTVTIRAPRETVFQFLTDTPRWAAWWGAGSRIDATPGGRVHIVYPGGTEVSGEVIAVDPPKQIVFSYGFVKGTPIPPGASKVTIRLETDRAGTQVHLTHEFADEAVRNEHVQGWRYQLALFGNLVADAVNAGAAEIVDAWFDAWAEPDADKRQQTLSRVAAPEVHFRDRFGCTDGIADLMPHIAAAQHFMPGLRLSRQGDVRHCQGAALVDWVARGSDGQDRGRGTNVFMLGADGRIEAVTGFWSVPS
jgi:uncharacterized protein YndB with AHSA1/START domain